MDQERWEARWRGYMEGTLQGVELEYSLQQFKDPKHEDRIKGMILREIETASSDMPEKAAIEARLLERLIPLTSGVPRLFVRRALGRWGRVAAVAAFLAGAVYGGYLLVDGSVHRDEDPPIVVQQPLRRVPLTAATDRVTLTLADGSRILLDAQADGAIASQDGAAIVKYRDAVNYNTTSDLTDVGAYNTVETPRGGRFQVNLSDGSRVWLNAASRIRFPVRFTGDTRTLELTGQAYFEVAHESGRPFFVQVGDARVEVFGTRFDVMGYADEGEIRTTLLEGSVGFRRNNAITMLTPGQQSASAQVARTVRIRNDLDVQDIIGWKEGRLNFQGESIGEVCRALSRAFDVRLEYDERIREQFYASFPENGRLELVLKALEMTGKVRFEKREDTYRAMPHS